MLKEMPDIDYAIVPAEYEIFDTDGLAERLGFRRDTVLVYLNRRSFHRIPKHNRHLKTGPLWYEGTVREWERHNRKRRRSACEAVPSRHGHQPRRTQARAGR